MSGNKKRSLPKTPLAEVVFEFRWALQGSPAVPVELHQDPGYGVLASGFGIDAAKHGLKHSRKLTPPNAPVLGHSVHLRFLPSETESFPIWQIGPGLFAANQSDDYEWKKFKKLCLDGLKVLYENYPKAKNLSIVPVHLELRYIDVFDPAYATRKEIDLLTFLNEYTGLRILFEDRIQTAIHNQRPTARLFFDYPIKDVPSGSFVVDIASASRHDKDAVRMETKVVSRSSTLGLPKDRERLFKNIDSWLEKAHNVLSPFFKEFVNQELREKFDAI